MIRYLLPLLLGLSLTACAAPAPNGSAPSADVAAKEAAANPPARVPQGVSDDGEYPRPKPPLPSRDPLPPEHSARKPVVVDNSCKTNADCAVKNVGNCCGYYPACVNKNSPTDPAAVQAQCAKSGMMSVCGWQEISSCSCLKGKCEAKSAEAAAQ